MRSCELDDVRQGRKLGFSQREHSRRAEQAMMPVMGFLNPESPDGFANRLRGSRQGIPVILARLHGHVRRHELTLA